MKLPRTPQTNQGGDSMLTPEQVYQFKTFGFVIMRSMLTSDELKTIQTEFDRRSAEASSYEPFDGTKRHSFNMMGNDTPLFASLLEDPRFAEAAEQFFGDVIGHSAAANRYVTNSSWHYDSGCYEGYGVKFAMYLQPVRADTGALRVIPGSHKRPWFDELDERPPLRYAWARQDFARAEAPEVIGSIPGFACESDPGDVVAFDERLWHASIGGSNDRQMCDLVYINYPTGPQEVAATITQSKGYLTERDNSAEPWNPRRSAPDEWLANRAGNLRRQLWIDSLSKFSEMKEGENGFKTVAIDGKLKVVTA